MHVFLLCLVQDVENQLSGIRELSKNRKFNLIGEYVDEGVSGRREKSHL